MRIDNHYRKPGIVASVALTFLLVVGGVHYAWASIDGTIGAAFSVNDRRTVGTNPNANIPVNLQPSIKYTNGAGAGQASVLYQANLTLTSGSASIKLTGTVLDSYGTQVNLVRVKAIFLQNNSASNPMTFGAAPSNAWSTWLNATGTMMLPAGAWCIVATPGANGWGITAGTADTLQVTGTGTDGFTVVILGSNT